MDYSNPSLETCRNMILSEDYIDLISHKGTLFFRLIPEEDAKCIEIINNRFAILHYPINKISNLSDVTRNYRTLPKLYGLQDTTSIEASGILRLQNLAGDRFRGKNVLIGLIDTGERVIIMLN